MTVGVDGVYTVGVNISGTTIGMQTPYQFSGVYDPCGGGGTAVVERQQHKKK